MRREGFKAARRRRSWNSSRPPSAWPKVLPFGLLAFLLGLLSSKGRGRPLSGVAAPKELDGGAERRLERGNDNWGGGCPWSPGAFLTMK